MSSFQVSVAVITYNQAPYVGQALRSILSQKTSLDFEVVVGDDASTDGTRAILEDLARQDPRVRLQLRDSNVGANRNFREVFAACKGKYVAVLEGDDFWIDPEKLQKQVDFLESSPACTVVGAITRVEKDGTLLHFLPEPDMVRFTKDRLGSAEDFIRCHYIHTSSVMFRNVFGGQIPDFGKIRAGDRLLLLLHAERGKIGFLHEEMSVYRQVSGGIYVGIDEIQRLQFDVQSYSEMKRFLRPELSSYLDVELVHYRGMLVSRLEQKGRFPEARQQLTRMWAGKWMALPFGYFAKMNLRLLAPGLFGRLKGRFRAKRD